MSYDAGSGRPAMCPEPSVRAAKARLERTGVDPVESAGRWRHLLA
ncbi:hypothetical protein NX801_13620 [Streptomyces sp. LP05-1]|uniref:Uncharacterized protein n=1 Tax=Streptomyces pyxinae TaxID=2970734 RepID=A0ABT2CH07_9ACTN|nr:hypothetical protein [Streptomyces sp. LP05-1]MCS0636678.1 hypothetical protein [Streptomyces sp. LP05-1]